MKQSGFSATAMASHVPMAQLGVASVRSDNGLNRGSDSGHSIFGAVGSHADHAAASGSAGIQAQAIWGQSSTDKATTPVLKRALDKK